VPYGYGRDGQETFTKVEAQNLHWIDNGGQGGLLVPAQQKIDVDANLFAQQRGGADAVRPKSCFYRLVRELFHGYVLHL